MIVTVPLDTTTPLKGVELCQSGADTLYGRTRPAAWINVSIQAIGTCTPGANGRMMHCHFSFASPGLSKPGKRRRPLSGLWPTGADINSPLVIECDGGSQEKPLTFWVGTPCVLSWIGGTPGDQYQVTVSENVPRDETERQRVIDVEEAPFEFRLTHYFFSTGDPGAWANFPAAPPYYDDFRVVQGASRLVGPGGLFLPLDNSSTNPRIPLSGPRIQIQPGVYELLGAV